MLNNQDPGAEENPYDLPDDHPEANRQLCPSAIEKFILKANISDSRRLPPWKGLEQMHDPKAVLLTHAVQKW